MGSIFHQTLAASGTQTFEVAYEFDAFDRRTARIETAYSGGAASGYTVERFVYDGTDVVLDLRGTGATLALAETALAVMTRYLWAEHMSAGETSLLLAQENVTAAPVVADVLWAFVDHQSTVRDLVRLSGSGSSFTLYASAHYQFDSFGKFFTGKENGVTVTAPTFTRYTFTSQEYDKLLKTYYYDARMYDPNSGKFLIGDPLGFGGGQWNVTMYTGNDPVNYTDPSGNEFVSVETDADGYSNSVFWNVEADGTLGDPNTNYHHLGYQDDAGNIHLGASWGGGTVLLAELQSAADKFWNNRADMSGRDDENQRQVIQHIVDALRRRETLVQDAPESAPHAFVRGYCESAVDGRQASSLTGEVDGFTDAINPFGGGTWFGPQYGHYQEYAQGQVVGHITGAFENLVLATNGIYNLPSTLQSLSSLGSLFSLGGGGGGVLALANTGATFSTGTAVVFNGTAVLQGVGSLALTGGSLFNLFSEAADLRDAGILPDYANVVRGGLNTPERIAQGTGTHPSGVAGVSVECAPGKSVAELSKNIKHGKVGTTTVGEVRAAGGDVIPTSGRSPNHGTMTGLDPNTASELLQPIIPNPAIP